MRAPPGAPLALALALLTLAVAPRAGAEAVLLPPHLLGPVPPAAGDALLAAFAEEIARRSGSAPRSLDGPGCPDPTGCEEAAGSGDPRYWLQISGDEGELVAVAVRLDGATEGARASAAGTAAEAATLGTALGADVAAGAATGLTVEAGLRRATVTLDGEVVGQTPLTLDRPIPAGLHRVLIEARDGRTALAVVRARAGEPARVELDLGGVPKPAPEALAGRARATPPRQGPGAWPLLPVAVGAAVAGVLFATDPAGLFQPDYVIVVVPP